MIFWSRKDSWLGIIIWLSILIPFVVYIIERIWYGLLIMIPYAGFVLWIWFRTYYEIIDNELIIKSGPFKERVALDKIVKIRSSSNPIASLALSLKRLEIQYGKYNFTYISPEKEEIFLSLIKDKNPEVKIEIMREYY